MGFNLAFKGLMLSFRGGTLLVAQFVEALRYKPEGRGFDSQCCHWHNSSGRTMALGSTQPLREMSIRNISWMVKAVGAYGWQTYHLHVLIVLKSGSLNFLETSGTVQAFTGIVIIPSNPSLHISLFRNSRCQQFCSLALHKSGQHISPAVHCPCPLSPVRLTVLAVTKL